MSEQAFKALFREIDPEIEFSGDAIVHMAFDDPAVVLRASLSSDERQVVTDIYLFEMGSLDRRMRDALNHAILTINDLAAMADTFSVSVDARGMCMLTGRSRLAEMTADAYGAALGEWFDQVRDLLELAQALGRVDEPAATP
ncbi:MAG: hypothetical protein AAF676_14565 [Pseudomonadota bacterium]